MPSCFAPYLHCICGLVYAPIYASLGRYDVATEAEMMLEYTIDDQMCAALPRELAAIASRLRAR